MGKILTLDGRGELVEVRFETMLDVVDYMHKEKVKSEKYLMDILPVLRIIANRDLRTKLLYARLEPWGA